MFWQYLSETSQWHTTMPVGGGIHAINKAGPLGRLCFAAYHYGRPSKVARDASS